MSNFEKFGPSALDIFDDSFKLVSFHREDDGRMTGASLLVDESYLLDVETTELHMKRIELDDDKLDLDAGSDKVDIEKNLEQVYVIAASEILPSDLRNLKVQPRDNIAPFLVELED